MASLVMDIISELYVNIIDEFSDPFLMVLEAELIRDVDNIDMQGRAQ